MDIDPVSGFLIVWTFLGVALTYIFRLLRIPRSIAVAFFVALIPAVMAASMLSSN